MCIYLGFDSVVGDGLSESYSSISDHMGCASVSLSPATVVQPSGVEDRQIRVDDFLLK